MAHAERLLKEGWIKCVNKNQTFEVRGQYYKIYEDEIQIFLESTKKHREVERVKKMASPKKEK